MAGLKDRRVEKEPMVFPPLYVTFLSAGHEHPDLLTKDATKVAAFLALSINAMGKDTKEMEDICLLVRPSLPVYKAPSTSLLFSHFHNNAK